MAPNGAKVCFYFIIFIIYSSHEDGYYPRIISSDWVLLFILK